MFVYRVNTYHPVLPDARTTLSPRMLAHYAAQHPSADPTAQCWAILLPGSEWAVQFSSVIVSPVPLNWLDHKEVVK